MKKHILFVFLSFFCSFTFVTTASGIEKFLSDNNKKSDHTAPVHTLQKNSIISPVITINNYAAVRNNKRTYSKKIPLTDSNMAATTVKIKGKLVSKKRNKSLPGILELLLSKINHQRQLIISALKPLTNLLLPISNVSNLSIPPVSSKTLSLDPSQASKVLIFYPGNNSSYQTAYIVDGSFSIEVSRSNPIGMIFVDTSNKFMGYLYLKNNVASLPMSRVKAAIATIDLGELFSSGLVVEPENNPLGNEIPLTEDERKVLEQFNSLFASHPSQG